MRDVIIIGAGPAGSMAALLLARSGWKVTIVEQHAFPRDKVCGECLSALGTEVLARHGLLDGIAAQGATCFERALIHARSGEVLNIRLARPMLGVSRRLLDQFLLYAARAAGATVLQPARCESVRIDGRAVAVQVRELPENRLHCLSAAYVLIADGKSALPDGAPAASGELGIKSHWEGIEQPGDAIQLFGFPGGYGGFSRIENSRWNAAFAVSAAQLRACGGRIDAMFARMLSAQPALRDRLGGAVRVSQWIASPLPRFSVRKQWQPPIIPIGNAAASIDPIGGEGMGLALRSAELAAAALHESNPESFDPRPLRKAYQRLWRAPRALCRAGALVTRSTALCPAVFEWLSVNDALKRNLLAFLGK